VFNKQPKTNNCKTGRATTATATTAATATCSSSSSSNNNIQKRGRGWRCTPSSKGRILSAIKDLSSQLDKAQITHKNKYEAHFYAETQIEIQCEAKVVRLADSDSLWPLNCLLQINKKLPSSCGKGRG